jgi:hypothetical protein
MQVQNTNLPNSIRLLVRGRETPKLFVLFLLISAASSQSFADTFTLGGYTIFECGQSGSADFQACQHAMAAGEAEFLSNYEPKGLAWGYPGDVASPLPPAATAALPSLPCNTFSGCFWYTLFATSPDGRWAVIGEAGGPAPPFAEDVIARYVWNDGGFIPFAYPTIDYVDGGRLEINDQGTLAGTSPPVDGEDCVLLGPLGCLPNGSPFGDPSWFPVGSVPILNDDNQILVGGFTNPIGGMPDFLLFDPPGAPSPVPEPATMSLLAAVVGFSLASLHRHGRRT